ncbi:GrpB family protein [Patescibacteria group bacterium]|nr:GrpB family protein [Patescibacteria group bacterium]
MAKYVFKDYDPLFPTLFATEKARLILFMGEQIAIEHVGSTAVPGLGGKGIIDIAVAVKSNQLENTSAKAQQAGYEFKPHASNEVRLFHQQDLPDQQEGVRRYHLHVVNKDSLEYKKMIAFRNYLRAHPKDMDKYADIKKEAAKKANEDKNVYMSIKQPVIDEILAKALSEN